MDGYCAGTSVIDTGEQLGVATIIFNPPLICKSMVRFLDKRN